jgi:hypothetical protein
MGEAASARVVATATPMVAAMGARAVAAMGRASSTAHGAEAASATRMGEAASAALMGEAASARVVATATPMVAVETEPAETAPVERARARARAGAGTGATGDEGVVKGGCGVQAATGADAGKVVVETATVEASVEAATEASVEAAVAAVEVEGEDSGKVVEVTGRGVWARVVVLVTVAATVTAEETEAGKVVERHLASSPDIHPSLQGCSCWRRCSYRTRRRPHRSRVSSARCPRSEAYSTTSQMGIRTQPRAASNSRCMQSGPRGTYMVGVEGVAALVKEVEWEKEEEMEKEAAKVKGVVTGTEAVLEKVVETETAAATEEAMAVEKNPEPSPHTRPKRCSCSRFRSYRTPRRPRTCRRPTNRCSRSEVCSTTSQMGTQKH